MYEAENAVMLARIAGADKYAADSYQKALDSLAWAERNQAQKPGQKPAITMAREAVLRAEDARVIAIRAARQEALDQERQASLDRENAATAKADEEARQRARADEERRQAEAQRAAAEADRAASERAKAEAMAAAREADQARQQAVVAKLEADRARQEALEEQQKLAAQANQARDEVAKAREEQAELRKQLLVQFNQILQTRETARGLIVNLSDVLFDTAQYTLKPGAREKLAKLSGIILAHPGLKIAVEGHTDSVGADDYNMKLSENRAGAVRDYLVAQGLNSGTITAEGFGKTRPVADNSTAAGRQQNRRVELVVSGEMLGSSVNSAPSDVVR
jgi:outer membrane protein OmpA-like peptidoglycan-associated protein